MSKSENQTGIEINYIYTCPTPLLKANLNGVDLVAVARPYHPGLYYSSNYLPHSSRLLGVVRDTRCQGGWSNKIQYWFDQDCLLASEYSKVFADSFSERSAWVQVNPVKRHRLHQLARSLRGSNGNGMR